MTIDAFSQRLADILSSLGEEEPAPVMAREVASFFDVEPHEVGLFQIDNSGRLAIFRWPPQRSDNLATIPLKSFATSLVSATARERRATVDNAFAATPHLFIYERGLAEKEQRIPVQKIMSAPVSDGDRLRWIVQVSRKGASPQEAGPDFTPADLQDLEKIAAVIADSGI